MGDAGEQPFPRKLSGDSVARLPRGMVPARVPLVGRQIRLEPLDPGLHATELYQAGHACDAALRVWDYLPVGPWPDEAAFTAWLRTQAASFDRIAFAMRPVQSGKAAGMASYLDIHPLDGVIEIGGIWFTPDLQRTRAATEALFLLLTHAMDDLGYRRMQWRCNSLNAKSRAAARRLGFRFEGVFHNLYRTRFPGHKTRLSGLLHDGLVPCGPCVAGALETILLEQPGGVVSGDKVAHGGANLIDGLIDAAMDDLLLEGAEEPLRDTIGFGFTDERVAWAHAPEADLVLEVPGHEGAAMVVAQRDAAGSGGAEMAEDGLDRHADGLGRGVAIAAFADVPAGCLSVPVLDHAEQPDLAVLDGGDLAGVGCPHDIRRIGGDAPGMVVWVAGARTVRREQRSLAHQPQHALARDPDAVQHPQSRPDLAMAFPLPGRAGEVGADRRQQCRIRHRGFRATPARRPWWRGGIGLLLARGVERGARHVEGLADTREAIRPAGGGGDRAGHHRDLLRGKGPGCPIRARSSSFSMQSSPIRCIAAASSTLSASASRSLSAASIAACARSRQRASRYSGTPSSRESNSAGSPRISRSTTSRLRATLQRCPGANGPTLGAASWPVDSMDGLRPPTLPTGPSADKSTFESSIRDILSPPFLSTMSCPGKSGAAQQ